VRAPAPAREIHGCPVRATFAETVQSALPGEPADDLRLKPGYCDNTKSRDAHARRPEDFKRP
jgi:hypothetical protein